MRITKFGHCCLLVEDNGVRMVTDPGSYTTEQNSLTNIDLVLITHEHQDHFHVASVKKLQTNNPDAVIMTNAAVGELLDAEGVKHTMVNDTDIQTIQNITIEAFEWPHAEIYKTLPRVLNTGFLINNHLFFPGDSLIEPKKDVFALALPTAGPWLKISEAIDYAKAVKPQKCFPIHDAVLTLESAHSAAQRTQLLLQPDNIEVIIPEFGSSFII